MARVAVVNVGLLFVFCWLLRCTWAGYCTQTYTCTKPIYWKISRKTQCGDWWATHACTKYSVASSLVTTTCTRKVCCQGYVGSKCELPVCFGSTRCPNGGTCISPNKCFCRHGYSGSRCEISPCSIGNGGCQHYCENTVGSFRCSCSPGHMLGVDGKTCQDLCEHLVDKRLPTGDDNCRTYVQCGEEGTPTPLCCRSGRRFDVVEGGCVTTNLTSCIQKDCPDGHEEDCTREETDEPSKYYDLKIKKKLACPAKHIFDPETCRCKTRPGISSAANRISSGIFGYLRVLSVIYLFSFW